jgi:uncharacterized integral membrane protein (TIGR00698 family)
MSVKHQPDIDTGPASTGRPAMALRPESVTRSVRPATVLPGMAAAAGIAAAATFLGGLVPVVGAPVFAIVAGIVVSSVRSPAERLQPGLVFTARRVLQGSIMVLGLDLSLHQVLTTGVSSLPVLLGTLVVALVVAWLVGRALHLRSDLNTLIGVGTAICGASAIAATDAVIDADEADVSYAIATIFAFNVVAVLTYPALGHALGLSQHAFGLWAGTAINDTSSVVAASSIYGHAASSYSVVVKLTRTLAIIPICLGLAVWRNRHQAATTTVIPVGASASATPRPAMPATRARFELRRVFPMFILGFIAAVTLNTVNVIPTHWHHGLSDLATWMITAALAAIGLSTKTRDIRHAGPRPILLGAILWATVGIVSLALQAATGTI